MESYVDKTKIITKKALPGPESGIDPLDVKQFRSTSPSKKKAQQKKNAPENAYTQQSSLPRNGHP